MAIAIRCWFAPGSGVMTLAVPDSAGVPEALAALTRVAPYNSLEAVERYFAAEPGRIAAVIVEPLAANMGVVPPAPGFLKQLGAIVHEHGALLICDEVITGFRLRYGAAYELFEADPGPRDAGQDNRRRTADRRGCRARRI